MAQYVVWGADLADWNYSILLALRVQPARPAILAAHSPAHAMIAFAYAVIVGGLAFGAVLVITMLVGCVQPSAKADLGINASVELTRPCR